jgi:hypothetical protein
MMHRDGWTGRKSTSAVPYAWLVWERGHQGPFTVYRITANTGNGCAGSKSPPIKDEGIETMAKSPKQTEPENAAAPNPFDIDALRLDQDFEEQSGALTLLTTVPVRKPSRQEWIHVHPGEDYRGKFAILTLKEERETYLVAPRIARELRDEVSRSIIYVWQNGSGVTGLWPIQTQGPNDKANTWYTSAHEAALRGMKERVRVSSNMALKAYETTVTINPNAAEHEPHWPSQSLQQLLEIGFKGGMLIDSLDHPVVKRMRGD